MVPLETDGVDHLGESFEFGGKIDIRVANDVCIARGPCLAQRSPATPFRKVNILDLVMLAVEPSSHDVGPIGRTIVDDHDSTPEGSMLRKEGAKGLDARFEDVCFVENRDHDINPALIAVRRRELR
jgi:hypothetical protein